MKRNIAICIVIIVYTFSSKAQNITFEEGPELELKTPSEIQRTIGEDENSFYILRTTRSGLSPKKIVEKYNKKNMTLEYSTDIELLETKRDFFVDYGNTLQLTLINNEIVIFYDLLTDWQKKRSLYQKTIDKDGNLSIRKEIESLQSDAGMNIKLPVCQFIFTKDKKKLLIQKIVEPRETNTAIFSLFDYPSLTNIWNKSIDMNYNNTQIHILTDSIMKNGTAYISFETESKDPFFDFKKGNFNFTSGTIAIYYTALIKPNESTLSNVTQINKYSDDSKYRFPGYEIVSKKGKIIRAGLYNEMSGSSSEKDPANLKMGTYFSIIDPITNKTSNESYAPFPSDVNNKLTYKIEYSEYKFPSNKIYKIRKIVEMNEDFYIIAENSAIDSLFCSYSPNYSISLLDITNTLEYQQSSTNRELIITKFNNSGKSEWTKIIPKYTNYSGNFNVISYNKKLFFFYLENPQNEKFDINNYTPKDNYSIGQIIKANTVCTTLEANGNMSKQVISKPINGKGQYYFCPNWIGVMVGDNKLIVNYQAKESKYKTKLGLITIK